MFISTNQLHLTKSGICISVEILCCWGQSWCLSGISGLTCLFYNSLLRTLFCLPVRSFWVYTHARVGKVVKEKKRKNRLSCWFYKYMPELSLKWRAVHYLGSLEEEIFAGMKRVEKSYVIHTLPSSVLWVLCFSLNMKFWGRAWINCVYFVGSHQII